MWSILFFTAIFLIIGIIGIFIRPKHEYTEHQLQELERIKSNGFPPTGGS